MNNPPKFIHLFIRQFWRILKMDYMYPSQTDNPSLEWKRPVRYCSMIYGHLVWSSPLHLGPKVKDTV